MTKTRLDQDDGHQPGGHLRRRRRDIRGHPRRRCSPPSTGWPPGWAGRSPRREAHTLYLALALGYMYLVTLLAWQMARHPEVRVFPWLLVQAKAASAVVCLGLFALQEQYLLYLANFVVDGAIALFVWWLCLRAARSEAPEISSRCGRARRPSPRPASRPVMNLRLTLLGRVLLPRMRRRMLDELARVTAEGFGTAAPEWTGGSFDIRLADYARFTAREAGRARRGRGRLRPPRLPRNGCARAPPGSGLRCAEPWASGARTRRSRL